MSFIEQLDMGILLFVQEHMRVEALNGFWRFVTSLGNGGWLWIFTGLALVSFIKTREAGITVLLSLGLGFLLTNLLLKNIVARPRPFDINGTIIPLIIRPTDYSFPSGHTCASFASAFVYLRMLPKKYGIAAVILAVLVAYSRLYVGVHYPSDIAGGILAAAVSSFLALRIREHLPFWREK